MADTYPYVSFHFKVSIAGLEDTEDTYFQSVSGLDVSMDTEEYAEGGENRFKHKLPVKTKYSNLILKKGLAGSTGLTDWFKESMENFNFETKTITIDLLNEKHEPLVTWNVVNAFPVKLAIEPFNSMESKMAIESMEFSYQYFTRIN
ncbi:phage tail protein [Cyclobacterium sp. 1_MG-2023]|uniref:phage tail protein n=1 Tax=Cyclobacterium sp. 1_MG-2023 TaxID=3062681 RepID=UPI0026E2E86F|nr:phage tail protein [Cyclobacterium sp. 1_MG-2023]MDO6436861.1 phage tail protein [Cyclobacterium sp. 1_MG-2023]|tara:strand:- start:230 stop:670 length:441 start_codon:yes stop_codon:yes gene_type:complete